MKKMITLIVCLVTVFALFGCSQVAAPATAAAATTAAAETTAAPETTVAVETTAEEAAETAETEGEKAPAAAIGQKAGGWTPSESPELTEERKEVFARATEGLLGVNYEPVAYLGSQVVAGTNHCFLAQATVVRPGEQPRYVLVYIWQKLDGTAEIRNIADLDISAFNE